MLNVCRALFTQWNKNGVSYCHWKSNEHLEEGLDGLTDLDVLLSYKDKNIGSEILRLCGYVECKSRFGASYNAVTDWIGFDEITGKLIHVHLHYRLITGHKGLKEYSFPWTQFALDSRILDSDTGVYIMEPNLELITLYARISLKASKDSLTKARKKLFKLGEDDQKEITYLKKRIDWKKVEVLLDKFIPDQKDNLLSLYKGENFDGEVLFRLNSIHRTVFDKTREHGDIVTKLLIYFYRISFLIRLAIDRYTNLLFIFRKTFILKEPLSIAFIGQDGSGKSTVSNDIIKWLNWKIDARRVYLGSGEHYHSWEKSLLNKLSGINSSIFAPLKCFVAMLDYLRIARRSLSLIRQAKIYSNKGGVAIFDRLPQVQYKGINDGPKIATSLAKRVNISFLKSILLFAAKEEEKILTRASEFSPTIVFKLMLSPDESLLRKPEENLESVKRKHEIIKNWEFDNSDVFVIDATQPYDEELLFIKQKIWHHILKSVN